MFLAVGGYVMKKTLSYAILSLVLLISLSVPAFAQQATPKKQHLDFDGVTLEGEFTKPALPPITGRNELEFPNLIQKRTSFEHELVRSASALK